MADPLRNQGTWDASSGAFPATASAIGDFYRTTTGGTVDGVVFEVNDFLIAEVASPSTTTFAGNWSQIDVSTDPGVVSNNYSSKSDFDILQGRVDDLEAAANAGRSQTYLSFAQYGLSINSDVGTAHDLNDPAELNVIAFDQLQESDNVSDYTLTPSVTQVGRVDLTQGLVTFNFTGVVKVSLNVGASFINADFGNVVRYAQNLKIQINGVDVTAPKAKTGYIRGTQGGSTQLESSFHIPGVLLSVTSGDQIGFVFEAESTDDSYVGQPVGETNISFCRIS